MTADMLAAYYSRGCNSESMFSSYKIAKTKNFRRYLNHYDVIHFDVQWCMEAAGGAEYVIDYISSKVIQELQEVYPDFVQEKSESISETLSLINEKAKVRFVIIIDEWDEMIRFQNESQALLDATLDMDEETIAYLSSMKYYFKPVRELPTGRGFADFVYLPKPEYRDGYPALLVELKWNQKASAAIAQIREKNILSP